MKSFWITFYSYKGGVGRSLALANCAALLVRRGRRVLLIDFDLEAPGLDSFAEFSRCGNKEGVVEYASKFIHTSTVPDIANYVHPCELPGNLRGKLWVMPAGKKDAAYNRLRAKIDWSGLYDKGIGQPFVDNWKAAIQETYAPDYVFVDSRTGLTDVGGICTLQLPDLVVLLFALNDQNIRGTAAIADAIVNQPHVANPYILPVATPIPRMNTKDQAPVNHRIEKASKILGVKVTDRISYFPEAALAEKLFVLQGEEPIYEDLKDFKNVILDDQPGLEPVLTIQYQYEKLLQSIIEFDRSGMDFLITRANEACKSRDEERAYRIAAILERDFPTRSDSLFAIAKVYRAFRRDEDAGKYATAAVEIEPTFEKPLELLEDIYKNRPKQFFPIFEKAFVAGGEQSMTDDSLQERRAVLAMKAERWEEAAQSYSLIGKNSKATNSRTKLIESFNLAESERRLRKQIDKAKWSKVLKLNEGLTPSDVPETEANRWQAMHIAYACLGLIDKSIECLLKADELAAEVEEFEDIFTVKDYRWATVSEFRSINKEMVIALNENRLWDGMKLPVKAIALKSKSDEINSKSRRARPH